MTWDLVLGCLLIFIARLADVSLDTLRMVAVIRGRRAMAWGLGFIQVLIWVYAISAVMKHIAQPPYAIAYALGFATGNFLGITIEGWLAHGEQVIRIFTRRGEETAARLRAHGCGVTIFDGRGKDGPVSELYIHSARKKMQEIASIARQMDPECYYVVEDVRLASTAPARRKKPRGAHGPTEPSQEAAPEPAIATPAKSRPGLNIGAASGGTAK